MLKRTALASLGLGFTLLVSPLLASADALSDLQAQLQSLMTQLQALQAQVNQTTTTQTTVTTSPAGPTDDYGTGTTNAGVYCPKLSITMQRGSRDATTGGQVSELQTFLTDYYNLDENIVVGGYFGKLTESYLIKFQNEQGLPAFGIAGSLTRAKIASVCGEGGGGAGIGLPLPTIRPQPNSQSVYLKFTERNNSSSVAATFSIRDTNGNIISPVSDKGYAPYYVLSPGDYTATLLAEEQNSGGGASNRATFKAQFKTDGYTYGIDGNTITIDGKLESGIADWLFKGFVNSGNVKVTGAQGRENFDAEITLSNSNGNLVNTSYFVLPAYKLPVGRYTANLAFRENTNSSYENLTYSVEANSSGYLVTESIKPTKPPEPDKPPQACPLTNAIVSCKAGYRPGGLCNQECIPDPNVGISAPVVNGVKGPASLNVGQTGTWSVSAFVPNKPGVQLSYSVTWGDEADGRVPMISSQTNASLQTTSTFTHTYQNNGTYRPTFTVTNSYGSASAEMTVAVGGIPPANNTRLTVTAPPSAIVGSSHLIQWGGLSGPTLAELARAYPTALGEMIAYNSDQSLGIAQTVFRDVPIEKLLNGNTSWKVGTLTNDGRQLPSGKYSIAFYVSVPNAGGSTAIAQGNSSSFSLTGGGTVIPPAQLDTYRGYMNGSLFITTASISEADALANCKLNATNNPSSKVRCTWGDKEIFNNTSSASAPTLSLTANPTSVTSGQSSTLSWSSTNAYTCLSTGDNTSPLNWPMTRPTSGSQVVSPLTSTLTFSVTCFGSAEGSGSVSKSVTVTVTSSLATAPTCTISAQPSTVVAGATSRVTWNATGATSATLSHALNGLQVSAPSAVELWNNVFDASSLTTGSSSYTLTVTGAGGKAACATTITVTAPAVVQNSSPTIVNFTNVGTTQWTVPSGVISVNYLVVAGGGGGGSSYWGGAGGGGGAGGFRTGTLSATSGASLTVTVGAGGTGGLSDGTHSTAGSNSVFSSITSTGGGLGDDNPTPAPGNGGSGGGARGKSATAGGTGTTGQGNNGGTQVNSPDVFIAAGGGGAGAVGGNNNSTTGGVGGAGSASSISGASVTYAGGGGGGARGDYTASGSVGAGGGGAGGFGAAGTAGTANTGGGGGGGGRHSNNTTDFAGANGGSGIVIISYMGSAIATNYDARRANLANSLTALESALKTLLQKLK